MNADARAVVKGLLNVSVQRCNVIQRVVGGGRVANHKAMRCLLWQRPASTNSKGGNSIDGHSRSAAGERDLHLPQWLA